MPKADIFAYARGRHLAARALQYAAPVPYLSKHSAAQHYAVCPQPHAASAGVTAAVCMQLSVQVYPCSATEPSQRRTLTVVAAAAAEHPAPAASSNEPVPVTLISGISHLHNRALAQALMEHGQDQGVIMVQGPTKSPLTTAANFDAAVPPEIAHIATLDTLVTVVDATRFMQDVLSCQSLEEAGLLGVEASSGIEGQEGPYKGDEEAEGEGEGEEEEMAYDDRTVADVVIDQVEHANILVVCSLGSLHSHQTAQLQELLRQLNPHAKVVKWQEGEQFDPHLFLNTQQFDLEALQQRTGWATMLTAWEEHPGHFKVANNGISKIVRPVQNTHTSSTSSAPVARAAEPERQGVSTWLYVAQRPFHPERLMAIALSQTWHGVVRSSGYCWLATRNDIMGLWQSAGGAWQCEPSGFWAASLPVAERPADLDMPTWHPVWGDRCQQLVWTGINMQEEELCSMLDACLLTEDEMAGGPAAWAKLEDPLPDWAFEDHDHGHDHDKDKDHDHDHHHDHQ